MKRRLQKLSLEFLVKLRDALQMGADACQERIEKMEPKISVKPNTQEVDKLPWETKQGSKGNYFQTSKAATNNHVTFQALQKYVKDHSGLCALNGWRYWFHNQDENTLDRRRV